MSQKISGTAGVDTLNGTIGNDTIDGLAGADTMIGGLGYDVYYVDNAADVVTESLAEGTDKVYSSVTYTLPVNVEHLTLTGTANINAIGNGEDNTLTGNRGDNVIIGGGGVDAMYGGSGNDTYSINVWAINGINNKTSGTDYIVDSSGHDTVVIAGVGGPVGFKYVMQSGLEDGNFLFTDTAPGAHDAEGVIITGNSSANHIQTADGNDTLDGGKGADILDGGDGANLYIVDHKGDVIIDTLDDTADDDLKDTAQVSARSYVMDHNAAVEIITLMGTKGIKFTGSDIANTITGTEAKDTIHGGLGADTIDGGGGKDHIYGDGGADHFLFQPDTAFTGPITIMDFNVAAGDTLDIYNIITGYNDLIAISNWVRITDHGKDTYVEIDADGVGGGASQFQTVAILHGVNGLTGEDVLLTNGTIIAEEQTPSIISGTSGSDSLVGTTGSDTMYGGSGNDILDGGEGHDTLTGDAGFDFFHFSSASARDSDRITDFNVAQDFLDLRDILDPGVNSGNVTQYVQITDDGVNSTVSVNVDGLGSVFTTIAILEGVTGLTDEAAFVASGHLVVS